MARMGLSGPNQAGLEAPCPRLGCRCMAAGRTGLCMVLSQNSACVCAQLAKSGGVVTRRAAAAAGVVISDPKARTSN